MKTLTLPNNAQAIITVDFVDQFGLPATAPSTTGTATSSDTTLFSAGLTDNGKVVVVAVEGASGTGELTYTNGTLTDGGSVSIIAPVADSVVLDSTDAVITAQTSTASTAPATAPIVTPAAPILPASAS